MAQRSRGKPGWQRTIANERIAILFSLAAKEFPKHPERSRRYIQLANRIAMRYNVKIPKELKRRFCKKCYSYLVPGRNSRARTNPKQRALVVKCLECSRVSRRPYRRERCH